MTKKILVLAAHLDDEVLGVGGTIARRVSEGDEIYIHIVRDGIAERHGVNGEGQEKNSAERNQRELVKSYALDSAKILRVPQENVSFGGFSLRETFSAQHNLNNKNVAQNIEEILDKIKPQIVYTHHAGDAHRDHGVVNEATMIATRAISKSNHCIEQVFSYETPSSTEQSFQDSQTVFTPNSYVDITNFLDNKLNAFKCYLSEQHPFPHPRSPEKLKALAEYRGGQANMDKAEAFTLLKYFDRQN